MLKDKYGRRADSIIISSGGIYAFWGVEPPPNAVRTARDFDVELAGQKSRAIHLGMTEAADIIFCMTSRQKSHLISRFPWFEDKIHILNQYALGSKDEELSGDDHEKYDIEDPIGNSIDIYRNIFDEIKTSLARILTRWEEEKTFRREMSASYRIAVSCDHAGYDLKINILEYLRNMGHKVEDFGAHSAEKAVDYPDYARPVAESVANGKNDYGIVICGSGIGISIAANKIRGIRAFPCRSIIEARLSRQHNDTNVLGLGGRLTTPLVAREIVETWLSTHFEGGRHQRRVDKIEANPTACRANE